MLSEMDQMFLRYIISSYPSQLFSSRSWESHNLANSAYLWSLSHRGSDASCSSLKTAGTVSRLMVFTNNFINTNQNNIFWQYYKGRTNRPRPTATDTSLVLSDQCVSPSSLSGIIWEVLYCNNLVIVCVGGVGICLKLCSSN